MSIKHKLTSPYQVNKHWNNWDEFQNVAIYSYNTSFHKSTQKTPYELVFGQQPKVPNFLNNPPNETNYSDLTTDLSYKLKIIRKTARETQIQAKEKSKQYYNKTHNTTYDLKEDDLVLLYDAQAKDKYKTLKPNYKGPYKIKFMQVHANQNATLQISPTNLHT